MSAIIQNKLIWQPEDVDFIFASYRIFEEKLSEILKILPFSLENKKAWSPELVNLFLDICSFTDSILRNILSRGKENEEKVKIKVRSKGNKRIISDKKVKDLSIVDFEINLFSGLGLINSRVIPLIYPAQIMEPYKNYRTDSSHKKGWWTTYNLLKHNRIKNYTRANLENTIKALAGLFILLVRCKEEEFSRAYFRYEWTEKDLITSFMSSDRINSSKDWDFWYTTKLFTVSENPEYMTKNIADINLDLASDKCINLFGKFKS